MTSPSIALVRSKSMNLLPFDKVESPYTEGRELQKILMKAVALHTFGALLSMLVEFVNFFMVIKHVILLYLAFYSRGTLNIPTTVLYMVLALSANTLAIFHMSEFGGGDPGAITVNFLFFCATLVVAYFVGQRLIAYQQKLIPRVEEV